MMCRRLEGLRLSSRFFSGFLWTDGVFVARIHKFSLQATAYKKLNSQIAKKLRNYSTRKIQLKKLFILMKKILP